MFKEWLKEKILAWLGVPFERDVIRHKLDDIISTLNHHTDNFTYRVLPVAERYDEEYSMVKHQVTTLTKRLEQAETDGQVALLILNRRLETTENTLRLILNEGGKNEKATARKHRKK